MVARDEPEGVPELGASASSASAWPKPTEPAWAASLAEHWTPGEAGACERLAQLDLANYAEERDIPALNATSLLSPHLRFGEAPHARCGSPRIKDWQAGTTGIPLIDAGMRELWATGYMHNRVRMVVGSFLTKNLGIH